MSALEFAPFAYWFVNAVGLKLPPYQRKQDLFIQDGVSAVTSDKVAPDPSILPSLIGDRLSDEERDERIGAWVAAALHQLLDQYQQQRTAAEKERREFDRNPDAWVKKRLTWLPKAFTAASSETAIAGSLFSHKLPDRRSYWAAVFKSGCSTLEYPQTKDTLKSLLPRFRALLLR